MPRIEGVLQGAVEIAYGAVQRSARRQAVQQQEQPGRLVQRAEEPLVRRVREAVENMRTGRGGRLIDTFA